MVLRVSLNIWTSYWSPASLVAQTVKRLPAMRETQVRFLGWEDPLEKKWQSTPVFLPEEFCGQKSLMGYSPWGQRVGHDWVTFTHSLSPFILFCFLTLLFIIILHLSPNFSLSVSFSLFFFLLSLFSILSISQIIAKLHEIECCKFREKFPPIPKQDML